MAKRKKWKKTSYGDMPAWERTYSVPSRTHFIYGHITEIRTVGGSRGRRRTVTAYVWQTPNDVGPQLGGRKSSLAAAKKAANAAAKHLRQWYR